MGDSLVGAARDFRRQLRIACVTHSRNSCNARRSTDWRAHCIECAPWTWKA